MKFYEAIEVAFKPFIHWNQIAANIDQLIELGREDDPLVLPWELVPLNQFGVSPMKIVGGELVERSSAEMDAFELEYNQKQLVNEQAKKINQIARGSFNYGGKTFPMHDAARARYMAIALDSPHTNTNFMTITGEVVTVEAANIPAFMSQYYKQIQLITNVTP